MKAGQSLEMEQSIELDINDNILLCTPYKCLYWPEHNSLILGDLHLGKTAHFRKHGIAIPAQVLINDLQKLQQVLELYSADQLIVVGDMFHHNFNSDIEHFVQWREALPYLRIHLVAGNHDLHIYKDLHRTGIDSIQETLTLQGICFRHAYSEVCSGDFEICAHLHPGYYIRSKAGPGVKAACYLVADNHMVLPAFSDFTGLYTGYDPGPYHIYLATGRAVMQVK